MILAHKNQSSLIIIYLSSTLTSDLFSISTLIRSEVRKMELRGSNISTDNFYLKVQLQTNSRCEISKLDFSVILRLVSRIRASSTHWFTCSKFFLLIKIGEVLLLLLFLRNFEFCKFFLIQRLVQ